MLAEIFGVDGVIILVVVLVLLFGGAAIPKLARNLGSAQSEFKKGLAEAQKEKEEDSSTTSTVSTTRSPEDPKPR